MDTSSISVPPRLSWSLLAPSSDINSPAEYNALSDTDIQKAQEELATCARDHTCLSDDEPLLPTRILDVGASPGDDVRVIVPSPNSKAPQKGHYTALSYCWGDCPTFTSTTHTLQSRLQGIPIAQLPLTILHAVQVTRLLGLRYLWVDALCILQDDNDDWQRESARMDSVYGGAFVTIFALGARDCEGGLFPRIRPDEPNGNISVILGRFAFEPLTSRAWAFQEWILTSRRLVFTSRGVTFDCPGGFSHGFSHSAHSSSTLSPASKPGLAFWETTIMGFCSRNLTEPMDKLPALAGLAQRFATLTKGEYGRYLAGIWESTLPLSLLWIRHRPALNFLARSTARRSAMYRAPSWSWASIDGALAAFLSTALAGTEVANVISCTVQLTRDDAAFGHVSGGSLRIKGPLASFEKQDLEVRDEGRGFATIEKTETGRYPDYGLVLCSDEGKEATAALLAGVSIMQYLAIGSRSADEYFGLLLIRTESASFRRIGCGWCKKDDPRFDGEEHTIEII